MGDEDSLTQWGGGGPQGVTEQSPGLVLGYRQKNIVKGVTLLLDAVYLNTEFSNGLVTFKRLVSENTQIIFVVFHTEGV